jgi:hypothetical protein
MTSHSLKILLSVSGFEYGFPKVDVEQTRLSSVNSNKAMKQKTS